MPFNKGDFTQQGVNGHVNATVRLNEKRLVNIDLTSNEEAEGCTIAGTVTDLLNDKVYSIGSGVSGNIEITENGENINVAPYATATVNVAGGGMPYCAINYQASSMFLGRSLILRSDEPNGYIVTSSLNTNETYNALYQLLDTNTYGIVIPTITDNLEVIDMVNCTLEYDVDEEVYIIAITDPTVNSSINITDKK